MANEQLINWIKDSLSKGYSQDTLKEALLKQGYLQATVEEAFSAALAAPALPAEEAKEIAIPEKKEIKPKLMRKWMLISSIPVALVFIGFFLWIILPIPPGEKFALAPGIQFRCSVDEINSAYNTIKNYAFDTTTGVAIKSASPEEQTTYAGRISTGKKDLENQAFFLEEKSSGFPPFPEKEFDVSLYAFDDISYLYAQANGESLTEGKWLKSSNLDELLEKFFGTVGTRAYDVKEKYFPELRGHIEIIENSIIQSADESKIKVIPNKEILEKAVEKTLLGVSFKNVEVLYDKAVEKAEIEYTFDENCRIEKIIAQTVLRINESTAIFGEEMLKEEKLLEGITVKSRSPTSINFEWDATGNLPGTEYFVQYFSIPAVSCAGVAVELYNQALKENRVNSVDVSTTAATISSLKPNTAYVISACTSETEEAMCTPDIVLATTATDSESSPEFLICKEEADRGISATWNASTTINIKDYDMQEPIILPSKAANAVEAAEFEKPAGAMEFFTGVPASELGKGVRGITPTFIPTIGEPIPPSDIGEDIEDGIEGINGIEIGVEGPESDDKLSELEEMFEKTEGPTPFECYEDPNLEGCPTQPCQECKSECEEKCKSESELPPCSEDTPIFVQCRDPQFCWRTCFPECKEACTPASYKKNNQSK